MNSWQPITVIQLEELVANQLAICTPEHQKIFEAIRVPFYQVPIHRLGKIENVFVVAAFANLVLYYEDIEEGFEIQELSEGGEILNQGCNQYDLHNVLVQISSNPSFNRDLLKQAR